MTKAKFKLPRKTKKALKKGFWLYPADEEGNSRMARPSHIEKDYMAYKNGILRKLGGTSKKEMQEERLKLDNEVSVTDEILKSYVNDIFHKDYRQSSYDTLRAAKRRKEVLLPTTISLTLMNYVLRMIVIVIPAVWL